MSGLAPIHFEHKVTGTTLYLSLYRQILKQITSGHLAANSRLPSSRSLAAELGCSRGTVERAYELLLAERYICSAGAAGTRVNPKLDLRQMAVKPLAEIDDSSEHEKARVAMPSVLPFQLGLPALDAFPRKLWNRLINRHGRSSAIEQFSRGDSFGYFPLREALANYLAISRGVNAEPEQIFITAGFQGALSMIIQCLSKAGDKVWCEDPGYFRARDCFHQLGMNVIPVPVDEEGLQVDEGIKSALDASFALVTPAHQAPLGVALSLARRLRLLDWAENQKSWIIEDDYDGEFRYGEAPLPALKSLDTNERVIYTGSFSKVLIPSLKLGYIVVPKSLQARFEIGFSSLWSVGSLLEQKALTELMTRRHFSRHIQKMRKLYGERRSVLASELKHKLGKELDVSLQAGGMHLLGALFNEVDEGELQRHGRELGLGLHFLSSFQVNVTQPSTLLLSFTNVATGSAGAVVDALGRAIALSR